MRRSLIALWLIALMSNAFAADYELPELRGITPYIPAPPVFTRWSGYYVGGQGGFGGSRMNLADVGGFDIFNPRNCLVNPWSASNPQNCLIWPLGPVSSWGAQGPQELPKFRTVSATAAAYGAFIGYNSQWDDVVLGVDINYNHTSLSGASTFSRSFPPVQPGDGNIYDVSASATTIMKIRDYATLRARGGWAFGSFLPYATFGLAVGRGDIIRFASATGTPAPASPGGAPFVVTDGNQQSSIVWGYSAGLGIDIALGTNLFVRAEYEFVQLGPTPHINASPFLPDPRQAQISANINTVRLGAGYRF